MTRVLLALTITGLFAGCAVGTQATLTIHTQPEGAFLIEKQTGTSYGIAPKTVIYHAALLHKIKTDDGCFMVYGFEARWVSGVTASLDQIRICGSVVGDYTITFRRDPDAPGLQEDMQFALQVQSILAQQQQAAAAQTAAIAALLGSFDASNNSLRCTSRQVGDTVQTDCK
jgi:hypothetical protein